MSSVENFTRVTKILDNIFLQFFEENRGKEYSSGDIGKIFGCYIETDWLSMCEDLHDQGRLERRVEYKKNGKVRKKFFYLS